MSRAWNSLQSHVLVLSPAIKNIHAQSAFPRNYNRGRLLKLNWRQKRGKKTEQTGPNKHRDMNENIWVLIFARRPKLLKSEEWGIPVKKRARHRRWHMIENRVTRYHICHFSAISLKNPGDFLQEINQQIFSTHPTLQSRSCTPFLAACSQRRTAGFISAITCKYVWCHPEGDCTSLGLAVEWLETWLCLMRIRDDLCPPEGFRGMQQHAALEHSIF